MHNDTTRPFASYRTSRWRLTPPRDPRVTCAASALLLWAMVGLGCSDIEKDVTLTGSALLDGREAGQHQGIQIHVRAGNQLIDDATTDPDGNFVATLKPVDYELTFTHPGYETQSFPVTWNGDAFVVSAGDASLAVVMRLDKSAQLSGSVTSAQPNTPFDQAVVTLTCLSDVCGSTALDIPVIQESGENRGRFQAMDLAPATYQLEIALAGFARTTRTVSLKRGENVVEELELVDAAQTEEAVTLTGAAQLEERDSHEGITVRVRDPGNGDALLSTTLTDAAGAFSLQVSADRSYTLEFAKEGWLPTPLSAPFDWNPAAQRFEGADGAPPLATLELDRRARLTGRLVSDAEVDDWNAQVRSAQLIGDPSGQRLVVVQPDGALDLNQGVAPGIYTLAFEVQGHLPWSRTVALVEGANDQGDLQMIPEEPGAVEMTGTVRLAGRDDHEDIVVRATIGGDFAGATVTDPGGLFVLPTRRDDHVLRLSHPGFISDEIAVTWSARDGIFKVADTPVADHEVVLQPEANASLTGRIASDLQLTDWPSRAFVTLRSDDDAVRRIEPVANAPDDDNPGQGRFQFANLSPGDYTLSVSARGHLAYSAPVTLTDGENTVSTVQLTREASTEEGVLMRGVARLADVAEGGDHSGITVRGRLPGGSLAFTTLTDDDGDFVFPVSREDHVLSFERVGYTPSPDLAVSWVSDPDSPEGGRFEVDGDPLEEATVALTLDTSGSVRGALTSSAADTPFSDAVVRLECINDRCLGASSGAFNAVADPEDDQRGTFQRGGLVPGRYQLTVSLAGYTPITDIIDVDGETALDSPYVLVSDLEAGTSTVSLTGAVLLDGDAERLDGVVVRVYRSDRDTLYTSTTTDEQGRFATPVSPDLDYKLSASLNGWSSDGLSEPFRWNQATQAFEDAQSNPPELHLSRPPFAGSISVTVAVEPAWLPAAQRTATVQLVSSGALGDEVEDVIEAADGDTVNFAPLPEGTYLVRVSRLGFTTAEQLVELTRERSTDDLNLGVRLNRLSQAGLNLSGATVLDANLRDLAQRSADALRGANLAGIDLGAAEGGRPDLCGLDLSEANLSGAQLNQADLTGALLARADLSNARLDGALLTGVDLGEARLFGANFTEANLAGAASVCADGGPLPRRVGEAANLAAADLSSANFTGARFSDASYTNVVNVRRAADIFRLFAWESGREIPDNDAAGREQSIFVNNCNTIQRVEMSVVIDHTWIGDLEVSLIGPDDTGVMLHNRGGGNTDNLKGSYPTTLHPAEEIGAFEGRPGNGGWRLKVSDNAGQDEGYLLGWSLRLTCLSAPDQPGLPASAHQACEASAGPRVNLERAVFAQTNLSGANMNGVDLGPPPGADAGADLSSALLQGTQLNRACLRDTSFILADLRQTEMNEADLTRSQLLGAVLEEGEFTGAVLDDADLTGSNIRAGRFAGASMVATRLTGSIMVSANFDMASLRLADFLGATVDQTSFVGADLRDSRASGVVFSDVNFNDALLSQTGTSSVWRRAVFVDSFFSAFTDMSGLRLRGAGFALDPFEHRLVRPTLHGAELEDADLTQQVWFAADMKGVRFEEANMSRMNSAASDLSGASMSAVNMSNARMEGSNLSRVAFADTDMSNTVLNESDLSHSDMPGANLTGASLGGADLSSTDLTHADFREASLSGTNLSQSNLKEVNLSGVNLGSANLSRANLFGADLTGATMGPGTNLTRTDLSNLNLSSVDGLSAADLTYAYTTGTSWPAGFNPASNPNLYVIASGVDLSGADLRLSDLRGKNLSGVVNLANADLSGALYDAQTRWPAGFDPAGRGLYLLAPGADLSGADLTGVQLTLIDLNGVNFSGANLSGVQFESTNLSGIEAPGVDLSNAWISANLFGVNLAGANLSGARLDQTNLAGADLTGANLSGVLSDLAGFSGADLTRANLRGAILYDALSLNNATFTHAVYDERTGWPAGFDPASHPNLYLIAPQSDLEGADLSNADLIGAHLAGANLRGANLSGANLRFASLRGADLTGADLTGATLVVYWGDTTCPDGSNSDDNGGQCNP